MERNDDLNMLHEELGEYKVNVESDWSDYEIWTYWELLLLCHLFHINHCYFSIIVDRCCPHYGGNCTAPPHLQCRAYSSAWTPPQWLSSAHNWERIRVVFRLYIIFPISYTQAHIFHLFCWFLEARSSQSLLLIADGCRARTFYCILWGILLHRFCWI